MSTENKDVGARIRQLRIQKGVSQKEFAESINLHPVQYNRYEKDEVVPSTETLSKLADALDVSVDYLYEGQEADAATADFEDKELLHLFKEIEKCSPEIKEHAKFTLRAYVKTAKLQELAS